MALRTNSAEGGTNGVAATGANSGGGSGDAFNDIAIFSGSTITYSTSQKHNGLNSYHLSATGAAGYFDYSGAASASVSYRVYIYLPTLPSTGMRLITMDGATAGVGVNITGTGRLQLVDVTGTPITAFTTPLSTSTWYRVELGATAATSTTGSATLAYYANNSTSPVETAISGTTYNLGTGTFAKGRVGKDTISGNADFYLDDIAFNDSSSSLIGPVNTTSVSFRSAGASAGTGSSATLTLGLPTGTVTGDYLVAFVHSQSSAATVDWTPPSGWTKIGPAFTANSSTQRATSMFAKFAGSSEPSTFAFTAPGAVSRIIGVIHAYSGVDTTTPVGASSGFTATASASATLNVPAFTASSNLFTIEMSAAQYASPNSYALSSYTGGLTLESSVFRASGATQNPPSEDTTVSRSAMRIWDGMAPSGGVPAHVITTTGTFAQRAAALISLNAATSGGGSQPTVTPTIIGHTTARSSGATSPFTVDPSVNLVGSSVATDDWIIAIFTSDGNMAATKQPTPPAGWTNIVPLQNPGSGSFIFGVWAHKRASGDSTYSWTQTTAETNNIYHRLIFVRNADDIAQWITGTIAKRAVTAETTTTTAQGVTTTVAHTLGLLLAGERTTAAETDGQVTVSNFTKEWFENIVDHSLFVASKDMASAGSTGAATVTYPNTQAQNGIALQIGIPGIAGYVPPVNNGLSIRVSNGSSLVTTAKFKLADGVGGLTAPGAYKVVRPGYASVTQMLAQSCFYCAHRGGSRDFPEMSMYGYGQSALVGYPALEVSLARTSDGVWFGLHDASLDRTSFNTGGGSGTTYVAASMTWTQIQSYNILGAMAANDTSQPNRPYMRWEEIIDMYYNSHVIFVDPKVAIGNRAELLNMMDALPSSTSKFVGKYYGVSGGVSDTSGWNYDCHQRGYKTWGYFYDTDQSNYATYAPRWDILGMNYTAAQSYWDALAAAAPGKPIMGHICPDAAAVSTAISKGANGVMVSGVKVNVPPAIT